MSTQKWSLSDKWEYDVSQFFIRFFLLFLWKMCLLAFIFHQQTNIMIIHPHSLLICRTTRAWNESVIWKVLWHLIKYFFFDSSPFLPRLSIASIDNEMIIRENQNHVNIIDDKAFFYIKEKQMHLYHFHDFDDSFMSI